MYIIEIQVIFFFKLLITFTVFIAHFTRLIDFDHVLSRRYLRIQFEQENLREILG